MNQASTATAFLNLSLMSTTKPIKVIWTKEISAIFAIDFLVIALALFFHLLGIILILTNKSKRNGIIQYEFSNQHLLLLHLSIVSIIGIFINSVAIYHKTHRIRYPQYFVVIYYVAYIAYIINLVYLSFDRLVLVLFPLKYKKNRFKSFVNEWISSIMGFGNTVWDNDEVCKIHKSWWLQKICVICLQWACSFGNSSYIRNHHL